MNVGHDDISVAYVCGRILKRALNRYVFANDISVTNDYTALELMLRSATNLPITTDDGIRPYPVTSAKLNARVNYGRSVDMVAVNVYPIRGVNAI